MASEEDEQDDAGVSLQQTSGHLVYSKKTEIPEGELDAAHKLIKVGVIVSVDESIKTSIKNMAQTQGQLIRAIALPDNVHLADLPENVTLETEMDESENRTIMRMRIKPDPNTLLTPATLKFNLQCHYMGDESDEDSDQLALTDKCKSCGKDAECFYDADTEEIKSNDKGVQTDIALGKLLLSDSIASAANSEAESTAVQTYITAVNASNKSEEGAEQDSDKVETEHTSNTEKTSAGQPEKDEEEDDGCACEEEEEEEEEGGETEEDEKDDHNDDDDDDDEFCACEEELKEEEQEEKGTFCGAREEEKEEAEAAGGTKEAATEESLNSQEQEISVISFPEISVEDVDATITEIPSGVPLCLLRGDPPWVDPPADTYTVMWDTNLEVAPKDVSVQFKDTIDPMPSGMKVPDVDPLQEMRQSGILAGSFTVQMVSSDQSYFGGIMAGSSALMLKRDPELFNIHIDLNTWGFPASLYDRYAISATASIATLFDNEPSLGELLFMTENGSSMHSIYNPTSMADLSKTDTMSVGFIIEDGKAPPDIIQRSPARQSLEPTPEELLRETSVEMPMVPEDTRTPDKCNMVEELPKESSKGPRSISEELQSPASFSHSSIGELEEYEEYVEADITIETEKDVFELKWQEGLPIPQEASPHKANTLFSHPENKTKIETNPSTGKEYLKRFEEETVTYMPEKIKRDNRCKCALNNLWHSTPQPSYRNSASKVKYGVLAKALKDFEQQILPLHRALDDIKCKIQSLEIEDHDKPLSSVCSEESSVLSRSDSGYEQEIAELISSAQTEAMTAKFPCIQKTCCAHRISSSPEIPCMCDSAANLASSRRRKPCLRTDTCSMNKYMIAQRAAIVPLDMGITCLMHTPVEMITPTIWPHSSVYTIPTELGCSGACYSSPSESIVYQHILSPKKTPATCCRRTNEY